MTRRTKIVATLGPTTDPAATLAAILTAGVDVARINFSHGNAAEHLNRIAQLRQTAARLNRIVTVMADLPGPKLRIPLQQPIDLKPGQGIQFATGLTVAGSDDLTCTEPEVLADVRPGQRILLDDGRMQLEAKSVANGRLYATVLVGGTLLPNKGLNLPDTPLSIAAVTDRDRAALKVCAEAGVDWLALSFVREASAAAELRRIAKEYGLDVPVLAKIERPEGVRSAAAIVNAFDGIMVARGDLGVETPLEQLPMVQKQLINEARAAGKPVITATEMLDSMRENPRPTRAEVSDVSNAIYDGTDAVMLSGETAKGLYPVEAVTCMAKIAEETERHLELSGKAFSTMPYRRSLFDPVDESMAMAACHMAQELNATAIVTPTLSGRTARLLARYRPWARIVAPAPTAPVLRSMAMIWGVRPVPMAPLKHGDGRMVAAVRDAFAAGEVRVGDRVVVLAGHPVEGETRMPTVRVVRVGEAGASLEP
jgi:pyruvate kinase